MPTAVFAMKTAPPLTGSLVEHLVSSWWHSLGRFKRCVLPISSFYSLLPACDSRCEHPTSCSCPHARCLLPWLCPSLWNCKPKETLFLNPAFGHGVLLWQQKSNYVPRMQKVLHKMLAFAGMGPEPSAWQATAVPLTHTHTPVVFLYHFFKNVEPDFSPPNYTAGSVTGFWQIEWSN